MIYLKNCGDLLHELMVVYLYVIVYENSKLISSEILSVVIATTTTAGSQNVRRVETRPQEIGN